MAIVPYLTLAAPFNAFMVVRCGTARGSFVDTKNELSIVGASSTSDNIHLTRFASCGEQVHSR